MYQLIYKTVNAENGRVYSLPRAIKIGGKEIIFPCSISTYPDRKTPFIVEINDLVIVNFSPFTVEESKELDRLGINKARNIWAFDLDGNKVWEIMEATHVTKERSHPYISIWIKNQAEIVKTWNKATHEIWAKVKDGSLIASNFQGHEYVIDLSNGHVEAILGVS